MKDDQIKAIFEEMLEGKKAVSQEQVNKMCEGLLEEATNELGAGVYIKGRVNVDAGGVSFAFKRPGIGQRVQHFVACEIKEPKEKATKKADSDPKE